MFKRHEEEHVYTYVWVGPWLQGEFGIMEASISVVTKKKIMMGMFSHQTKKEVQCMLKMGLITLIDVK